MSDDSGQDVVNLEVCVLHIRNVGRAALLEGDESDCPILSWVRTSVRKGKQKHAADSNVILCFSSPLVKVLLFPSSHYSSSPPSSSPSSSLLSYTHMAQATHLSSARDEAKLPFGSLRSFFGFRR